MSKIIFSDSSLRDGSHAVAHNISYAQIDKYTTLVDNTGIDIIEVGHGNGLGASSLQLGFSAVSDKKMIQCARKNIQHAKLSVFIIPGFGSTKKDLQVALEEGVDIVKVATHCTEADIAEQYIKFVRKNNLIAYGVLMMTHMISKERLCQEARKMCDYGAEAIILMDSAGAYLLHDTKEKIEFLVNNLNLPIGFHAHNNLGLAVGNSLEAIRVGATIIDGTIKGFGAGAGNVPIEILAALLAKKGYKINVDIYKILELSRLAEEFLVTTIPSINLTNLLSGFYGIFSGFSKHVDRIAKLFDVDYKDVYKKLGEEKVVAGQEDRIVGVAKYLQKFKLQIIK